MKKITVFTPTYNRIHTLPRCYESLKKQTSKDFIWLIIDDGSEDGTNELVSKWIEEEKGFKIKYIYKENGGMHSAHNLAYGNSETELTMCLDSDDYLEENAINNIIQHWSEHGSDSYAGMVGLDAYEDGSILGSRFPDKLKSAKFKVIHRKYKGDKKFIYRTEVFNNYPDYPEFEDEKFTPLSLKYYLIDDKYDLLIINKVLCVVEYLEDGSSKNIIASYKRNPKGFLALRKVTMQVENGIIRSVITASQYVMGSLLTKNRHFIKESPRKGITILSIPLGMILFIYINITKRKTVNSKLK